MDDIEGFVLPGSYPSVDESFDRLHRAGWSIGETAFAALWLVSGTNGENLIRAEARSQAEAYLNSASAGDGA